MSVAIAALLLACAPQSTKSAPEASADAPEASADAPETSADAPDGGAETTDGAVPTTPAELIDGALVLETAAGALTVTPIKHGTVFITAGDVTLWLDPWSQGELAGPPADVVLVTDIHSDHMDAAAIGEVSQDSSVIVAPQAVADGLEGLTVEHVLANGEEVTIEGIAIRAVPMYNLVRGPESGGLYHDKGRGNGYLLTWGGRTVYFAGDTECTPEMAALTGVDLAFVPMNLPYTMPPAEAAGCVNDFAPAVVVPYHYGDSDLVEFENLVSTEDVTVALVDFYPSN